MTRQTYYNATGKEYADARYGDPHMKVYLSQRNQTLARIIQKEFGDDKPLRILEVGCGPGLSLAYLASLDARHLLFGIDSSITMIGEARKITSESIPPLYLEVGDAFDLTFQDNEFDFAYCTRMIHQFSHGDKKRLVSEMRRVVKMNGVLAIEFYARPYNLLRYYLGRRSSQTRESYLQHYPTAHEVHELIGPPYRRIPLRIGGAGTLYHLLGEKALRAAISLARTPVFSFMTDEYFVVTPNWELASKA